MSAVSQAWPHFVPRIELDNHIKDLTGRLDDVFKRLVNLEDSRKAVDLRVVELQDMVPSLATKQSVSHLESRLDLDVAICRQELVESQDEYRQLVQSEGATLREEAAADREPLWKGLEKISQHVTNLESALRLTAEKHEANFVPKRQHFMDCQTLRGALEESEAKLNVALDGVKKEKASRAELHEEHKRVSDIYNELRQGLAAAMENHQANATLLNELERRCPSGGKAMAPVDELWKFGEDLVTVRKELETAAAERAGLHSDLTVTRSKLEEGLSTKHAQGELLRNLGTELATLRESLHTWALESAHRAERVDKEIIDVKEVHMSLVRKCSEENLAHELTFHDVRQSHLALEKTLMELTASQKKESEHLKEYSTQRYLDQIDKALGLQQSINQVERGQVELKEAVALRLPKV